MNEVKKLNKPNKEVTKNVLLYIGDEHSANEGCQQNCACESE